MKQQLSDFDISLLTDVLCFLTPRDWASFQLAARSCYKACSTDYLWQKAAAHPQGPFRLAGSITTASLSSSSPSSPPRGGWKALLARCFAHHPPSLGSYLAAPLVPPQQQQQSEQQPEPRSTTTSASFATLNESTGAWRCVATASIPNGLSDWFHPQLIDPTAPADVPISPEQLSSVFESTAATSVGRTRVSSTCFVVSEGDGAATRRINSFICDIMGMQASESVFTLEATRLPLHFPTANNASPPPSPLATLRVLDLFPQHNFRPANSKVAHTFLLLSIDDDALRSAIIITGNDDSARRTRRNISPAQQQMEAANAAERAHRAVETMRATMELVYSISSTVIMMPMKEEEDNDDESTMTTKTPGLLEAMLHLSASDHRVPLFTFPGHFPDSIFVLPKEKETSNNDNDDDNEKKQQRVVKINDSAWQSFARAHLGLARRPASSVSLFFATHSREGFALFLDDDKQQQQQELFSPDDERALLRSDFAISWNSAPGVAPPTPSLRISGGVHADQGSDEALLHAGAAVTPHEYLLLVASAIRKCSSGLMSLTYNSAVATTTAAANNNTGGDADPSAAAAALAPVVVVRRPVSRNNRNNTNHHTVDYWTPSLIMSWLRPSLSRVTDAFSRRMKEHDDLEASFFYPPPAPTASSSSSAAAAAAAASATDGAFDTHSRGSSSSPAPAPLFASSSAPSVGGSSSSCPVELLPDVDTHRALLALSDASETASSHDGTGEGPDGEMVEDELYTENNHDVAMQRLLATFMEDEEFAANHLQQQRFFVAHGEDDDDNNTNNINSQDENDDDDDPANSLSNNSAHSGSRTPAAPHQQQQRNMLFERVHGRVSAVPDPSVTIPMDTTEFWASYADNALKAFEIALEVGRPYCPSSDFALALADQIRDGLIDEATRKLWTEFAGDSEKYCTQLISIVMQHLRNNYSDANVFEYRREKNALKRWYSLVHDKIEEYLLKARGPRHMLVLSVFISNSLVPEFIAACEADLRRQATLQGGSIAPSSNFGKMNDNNNDDDQIIKFIHPGDARQACSFLLKEIDGMLARCEGGMSNALLNDPKRIEFVRRARNAAVHFASEIDHLSNMRVAAVGEESAAFRKRLCDRISGVGGGGGGGGGAVMVLPSSASSSAASFAADDDGRGDATSPSPNASPAMASIASQQQQVAAQQTLPAATPAQQAGAAQPQQQNSLLRSAVSLFRGILY